MFEQKLRDMLLDFDLVKASALSDEIHSAEEGGYDISDTEDRLWARLTDRISRALYAK